MPQLKGEVIKCTRCMREHYRERSVAEPDFRAEVRGNPDEGIAHKPTSGLLCFDCRLELWDWVRLGAPVRSKARRRA
jgi:hypothetical protein